MNIRNRIISVAATLAAVIVMMQLTVVNASWENDGNVMSLLNGLKIMQGDGNGNYRLEDYVSRAEFTKVVVAASSSKDMVAVGLKISPFKDVKYYDWFAPYVHAGVNGGLCEGYIDGTFRPDNTVTYEEAITMILRALGYTDEDFGVSWPYGQVGMAQNLEITKGVDSAIGQTLTRGQVARLIYNALDTKMKSSSQKLLTVFDCTITEGVTIISSHAEDSTLKTDQIYTTAGKYDIDSNFNSGWVGKKGDIIVKNGDDLIAFMPDDSIDNTGLDKYVIYSKLDNMVVCYRNGGFKQIDIRDTTTCYKNTQQSTYGAVKSEMQMGDILYVKLNGETVDYVSYEKGNMEGPVKVTHSSWMGQFDTDSATQVMRDGNKTTASGILTNDIVYFSKDLNMVLAYTDKVTGIYESASPTKDAPTSIKLSGKEYQIESVEAFNALSSSGYFKIGDTVTILLGKDGRIAGVVNTAASETNTSVVGYVIGYGSKNYTNDLGHDYSSYYVTVVATDGTTYEYKLNFDASAYFGKVCKVTFKDGVAKLSSVTGSSGNISGTVSSSGFTIGSAKVAENVNIIDTSYASLYKMAACKRIYLQRIDGLSITSSKVLYYNKNSSGEITDLILNDVTGDAYGYGIVTAKSTNNADKSASYTLDVNGSAMGYSGSSEFSAVRNPVKVYLSADGNIQKIDNLKGLGSIEKLTQSTATVNNKVYSLSDSVLIYKVDNSFNVSRLTIDDAINGDYKLSAYYDKLPSEGGRIRVIVARD